LRKWAFRRCLISPANCGGATPCASEQWPARLCDVSDGVTQRLLRHSRLATLSMTATIDANALDTAANDLGKLRRVRVAPIRCTLGEIRSHHLQRVIESGRYHDHLRPATARDAWSGRSSE
jgi:hypothetical protein